MPFDMFRVRRLISALRPALPIAKKTASTLSLKLENAPVIVAACRSIPPAKLFLAIASSAAMIDA